MNTSLPIPTDNIYKFACFFGLALIVSAIFSYASIYTASLDRKIRYFETVTALEGKSPRTKGEDDLLAMNKRLIEVTKDNEQTASMVVGGAIGLGLTLSVFGALKWYRVIQPRDDRIATLQREKLEAEIAKLRA